MRVPSGAGREAKMGPTGTREASRGVSGQAVEKAKGTTASSERLGWPETVLFTCSVYTPPSTSRQAAGGGELQVCGGQVANCGRGADGV